MRRTKATQKMDQDKLPDTAAPADPTNFPRILEGVSRIGGLTDGRGANVFDTVFSG